MTKIKKFTNDILGVIYVLNSVITIVHQCSDSEKEQTHNWTRICYFISCYQ